MPTIEIVRRAYVEQDELWRLKRELFRATLIADDSTEQRNRLVDPILPIENRHCFVRADFPLLLSSAIENGEMTLSDLSEKAVAVQGAKDIVRRWGAFLSNKMFEGSKSIYRLGISKV